MSVKINKDIIDCLEITLRYMHKWNMCFVGMDESNYTNIINHMIHDLYNVPITTNLDDYSFYVRILRIMKKALDVLCAGYSREKTISFMEFMYSYWIRNVRDVVLDESVINNLITEFEENYKEGD